MRLPDETYEYIKIEVVDLFTRYDIKCIPISGFELALKMGIIPVAYSSLSPRKREAAFLISEDGFYGELGDGKEYIYYNDSREYKRSNMTILHEIGHAVLGHTEEMDYRIAEAEAGFFASYALAPPPLIQKVSDKSAQYISELFDISIEAAWYALERYCKWFHYGPSNYTDY
ncbi:MAG: ImmA/IrrE family metallo-endopeptidase, partial [Spirochaetales bacterium]|nr:ImmA/IrrE family metallo-endopeptidase [Spirochaetales bacterium]